MAEMTAYTPGTPSWVDIGTPDIAAAVVFYSGLFGWTCVDQGEEAGHYTMCELRGKAVAALGPQQNPGPPMWTTYISVADADATAAAISAAGGTVVMPPMDVMDAGRMAVAMDPTGGFFSIWQPKEHIGAQIVNEPGTLCWNELTVRDAGPALDFYTKVFGYTVQTQTEPMVYHELQIDGRTIGGCMVMDENWPADVPTHWMVYFATEDTDATAAKCVELGGTVQVPPTDIPPGRFAVLNDPQGGMFSVMTFSQPI